VGSLDITEQPAWPFFSIHPFSEKEKNKNKPRHHQAIKWKSNNPKDRKAN
jgi:hypothetical protein